MQSIVLRHSQNKEYFKGSVRKQGGSTHRKSFGGRRIHTNISIASASCTLLDTTLLILSLVSCDIITTTTMETLVGTTTDGPAFYYARRGETFLATAPQVPKSKSPDTLVYEMVSCTMKGSKYLPNPSSSLRTAVPNAFHQVAPSISCHFYLWNDN